MNREQWLHSAADWLDHNILKPHGARLPAKWSIGVGFPRGSAKAIGQCWPGSLATDGETVHMIISPTLGNGDLVNLLQVVLHECIHAAVGNQHKHGGEFKRVARAVGLEGKLTATFVSEGNPLAAHLRSLAESLGEYPHVELVPRPRGFRGGETPVPRDPDGGGEDPEKKPSMSGWVRYRSTREETYTLLVSPRSVENHGAPRDPWGETMVPKEKGE